MVYYSFFHAIMNYGLIQNYVSDFPHRFKLINKCYIFLFTFSYFYIVTHSKFYLTFLHKFVMVVILPCLCFVCAFNSSTLVLYPMGSPTLLNRVEYK